MQIHVTDEQFLAPIQALFSRHRDEHPSEPNLGFAPILEKVDSQGHAITFRIHTYPWMANPNRVVHGGVIATMLDNSMGILCAALYDGMTPTISMTINYALPVPLDEDIFIKVRATATAGTSAQVFAEIVLPGQPDVPLVTATGVYHTAHTRKPGWKRLSEML